eukprot:CAMPEP_0204821068 /NCGR_PEP_ID=MMETSP1018-20131115/2151_1 /ASSEMBLY_ACC=CAM_ASM_000518 /TAXON_ID=46462 /ORGANISM="Anophryoides haemophila, Strain AH6" /LENGTH=48 /DNA_ID=CAMNT_0051919541 /DNA_START=482 /DNA_END=631 /DNA_ORIENTATION=-
MGEMISDMMEDGDDMDVDEEANNVVMGIEKEMGAQGGGGLNELKPNAE